MVSATPVVTHSRIPLVDLRGQYLQIQEEIRVAIQEVLDAAYYIQGPKVAAFEQEYARYCETAECVAVDSGTAALELVLRALGIKAGDEVIVPAHTFIATAAAVVLVGATPVFVDVDEKTFQMTAAGTAEKITPRTRAVLAVHLYGLPVDLADMGAVCAAKGVHLVEDAAQAQGARLAGRRIGSWGKAACFSFYPAKNLGAYGDAGGITTHDAKLAADLRRLRDHGRLNKYEHSEVGYNYRMDAIQAAVLRVKLAYLDGWNASRRELAAYYRKLLSGLPLVVPAVNEGAEPVYHLFTVLTSHRDALAAFLAERNIETGVHYPVPLHMQPAFQGLGYKMGDFPVAERIGRETLSLPIFPEMTRTQVEQVCEGVRSFFDANGHRAR